MLIRNFIPGYLMLLLSACGGGGSNMPQNPDPNPPTTTTPSTTTLYIGYYTEDPTADPNDPTPGVIYVYLPDSDTGFNGEFFFSYQGCLGSYDTGLLAGNRSGMSISGSWSGNVDGTPASGTFRGDQAGTFSYSGSWTHDGGSQDFSFGNPPDVCSYTFAGKGNFVLYQIQNGTLSISVGLTSPFTPEFGFSPDPGAAAYKIDVVDQACLASGGGVSACTMWEDHVVNSGSGLPMTETYGSGVLAAKPLVSGNTYVVSFLSYDTGGSVLDFGSNQFLVP